MLASNFRFATEDVDFPKLAPLPGLAGSGRSTQSQRKINGQKTGSTTGLRFISVRWQMIATILSLVPFRGGREPAGLSVLAPTAAICSRLKLKSLRIMDLEKGG